EQAVHHPGGEIKVPMKITANHNYTFDPKKIKFIGVGVKDLFKVDMLQRREKTVQPGIEEHLEIRLPVKELAKDSGGKDITTYPITIRYGKKFSKLHIITFITEKEMAIPELKNIQTLQLFQRYKNGVKDILKTKMIGRDECVKKMLKFLKGDKPVLFIFGASGVGKTRFVLETLDQPFLIKNTPSEKWLVYRIYYSSDDFCNETILKILQNLNRIHSERRIVLLLDDWQECDDPTRELLVRKVVNQDFDQEKEMLKLVITVRQSSKKDVEKLFSKRDLSGMWQNKCQLLNLEPLTENDQKELLQDNEINIEDQEHVIETGAGYPEYLLWAINRLKNNEKLTYSLELKDPMYLRFIGLWDKIKSDKKREVLQILSLVKTIDITEKILSKEQMNILEKMIHSEFIMTEGMKYCLRRPYLADLILKYTLMNTPGNMEKLQDLIVRYANEKPKEVSNSIVKLQYEEEKVIRERVDIAVNWFLKQIEVQIDKPVKSVV
ncbi:MAG: hypothetical protein ACFFD4_23625, partial [Candidatus Odinarchaeota archaeon]